MKVPVPEFQQPQTRAMATPDVTIKENFVNVVDGMKGFGQAADKMMAEAKQAGEKADVVQVTEAEAYTQRGITATMHGETVEGRQSPGYLSTIGKDAAGGSEAAMVRIEKYRAEARERLTNDHQRELFDRRTSGLIEDTRRQTEGHVAKQTRVAEVETLKVREQAALDAIYNNPDDEAAVARHTAALEGPKAALSLSPEHRAAELAEWHKQVAAVRLERMLADNQWQKAEALYARSKDVLGTKAKEYEQKIAVLRQDREGEETATSFVLSARGENGRVDPEKARAAVLELPAGPLRDEVSQRLEPHLARADAEWRRKTDSTFDRALSAYLEGGSLSAIDSRDKAWLLNPENGAVEKWRELRNMARSDAEHYRSNRERASKPTPEQRDAYLDMRIDMANNPDTYRGMSAEEFRSRWGTKVHPSDLKAGGLELAGTQKRAVEAEAKGLLVQDSEFRDAVDAAAGRNGIDPRNKRELGKFRIYMDSWLQTWRSKHGEQRPPRAEVDAAIADALLEGKEERWGPDRNVRKYDANPKRRFYTEGADGAETAVPTATPTSEPRQRARPPTTLETGPSGQNGSTAPATKSEPPGPGWEPGKNKQGVSGWYNPQTRKFRPD